MARIERPGSQGKAWRLLGRAGPTAPESGDDLGDRLGDVVDVVRVERGDADASGVDA